MFLSQQRVDVERLCNRITKAWRYVCKLSSNRWEELGSLHSLCRLLPLKEEAWCAHRAQLLSARAVLAS